DVEAVILTQSGTEITVDSGTRDAAAQSSVYIFDTDAVTEDPVFSNAVPFNFLKEEPCTGSYLRDGGFELGADGPYWQEETTSGFPVVQAGKTGADAAAGNYLAVFGGRNGLSQAEFATLTQEL